MKLVETVARVIFQARWQGMDWDRHTSPNEQDNLRSEARAAIEATLTGLREPSADMCECGPFINEVNPNVPPITTSQADACWTAMIDQALTELREES